MNYLDLRSSATRLETADMPFPQSSLRFLSLVSAIPVFLVSAMRVAKPATVQASGNRTLTSSPSSVSFGNLRVGSSQTQYETLTNSGNSMLTISQATITGAGFSLAGLSLPLNLDKEQSVTFRIIFFPRAAGSASGAISVISNASSPNLTIAVSGTSTGAGQLSSSAPALNFGSVTVGTSQAVTVSLTAAQSNVTISSATSTSSEFRLSGLTLPKTIAPGQAVWFTLTFTPQSSGGASGSISLTSDAANTPTLETLTGTGIAVGHSVSLRWNSSTSPVAGYNVYRSTKSGGPYTRVNSALSA
jgi:hypothetical protein